MMICPNKRGLIVKCLYYCADRRVVKLIREMCFIYIHVYWKEHVEETRNTEEVQLPLYQSLKRKPVMLRHIFLPTLFPLPMVRSFWKAIYFIVVFALLLTSEF